MSDARENAGKQNSKSLKERYEKLRESEERDTATLSRDGLRDSEKCHEGLFDARENSVRARVKVGENLVSNARLPKGGWLKNPFEEIRYSGRNDPQNPIKFIKKFERIAAYEEVGYVEQLYYFGSCLRGTASNWFEIREPENINEAIYAFKEYFWGEEQQARFREEIYAGFYRRDSSMTMSEYALNLAKQAKYLEPPMSEHEIIRCVKRHFGSNIAREIRPTTVKNVEDFITLLDEIEYEQRRESKTYALNNNARRQNLSVKSNTQRETVGRTSNTQSRYRYGSDFNRGDASSSARYPTKARDVDGSNFNRDSARQTSKSYDARDDARADKFQPVNKYRDYKRYYNAERDNNTAISRQLPNNEAQINKKEINARNVNTQKREFSKAVKETDNYAYTKNIALIRNEEDKYSEPVVEDEIPTPCLETTVVENNVVKEDSPVARDDNKIAIIRTKEILRDVDEVTEEDQKTARKQGSPYVTILINKLQIKALVDTGSQISLITKDVYDKLTNEKTSMRIIPIKQFSLVGAFSDRAQLIANRIQTSFLINGREFSHEFYIVRNLSYEMILGMDFLSERNAAINCGRKFIIDFPECSSGGKKIKLNAISIQDAGIELNRILAKHGELFKNEIGCVKHYVHKITVNTEKPFKAKTYPVPEIHRVKVKEHLQTLERDGIIERANTQYVNPIVVVIKKTGQIRLCLDAREINKRMTNDHDQPPTIDEVFRRIGDKKYYSTLDVAMAFWQIPLEKESREFTGFKFDNQTYVFRRLPFGLKTAGASFTRAMQKAIGDECDPFTIVYLDDILIASNSLEEHLFHINYVLGKLRKVGFRLNKEKCEFLKTEIRFLGHTFDQIKADMNDDTKLAIQNFERPRNKKAIQAFLGLVNWDRRFIKGLARMTKPLEGLLKKNEKFAWNDELQDSFEEIKRAFNEAKCLFIIRPGLKFGLYVDASKYGLGARLYQYDEKEPEVNYTVAYASRSLKGAELNYTVTEIECLAIVWALRKWHTTLLGRQIKIHTDHKALKFITACADDSARIARWMAFLNEFELEICHVPGAQNKIADTLSRNNVKNGYAKKEGKIKHIAAIEQPKDEIETASWVDMLEKAQRDDEILREIVAEASSEFLSREGLIRVETPKGERIVVPEAVKWQLTNRVHDYLLHFGTDKVTEFMERFFSIQNLERVVRDVVASCSVCQATKYFTRPTRGTEYYVLPEKPGEVISIDLFGPLPQTPRGNKYILVTMDQFSKLTKLYPLKNQKLESIIDTLQTEHFGRVGIPREILSDNGGQFITARWQEFAANMGFSIRKTSPYNPQSNPVERVMRELGRIIRVYAHDRQTGWDRIVKRAEKTINSTSHRSTGYSPNELHPEQNERLFVDPRLEPFVEEGRNEAEILADRIKTATTMLQKRATQRKIQADKHGEAKRYQAGDKVWIKLHRRSDANRRLTRKIHLVYDGPYKIHSEVRRNAYVVEDLRGNALGTFNSRQLKPHRETTLNNRVEVNMLKTSKNIKKIETGEIQDFITDMQKESENEEERTSEEILTGDNPTLENLDDPEPSETGNGRNLKKRKRSLISEKGRRHISRLINLISGEKSIPSFAGTAEGQQVRIHFDYRGEFNVISSTLVESIDTNVHKLNRLTESKNIPAYLKREKKVSFKAVKVDIVIFQITANVEAMILDVDKPCILLGKFTCRELGSKIKEREKRMESPLTRWSEQLSMESRKRKLREEEAKAQPTTLKKRRHEESVSAVVNVEPDIQIIEHFKNKSDKNSEVRETIIVKDNDSASKIAENVARNVAIKEKEIVTSDRQSARKSAKDAGNASAICDKIKDFNPKDSSTPLKPNENDIRRIDINKDNKCESMKSVRANLENKKDYMRYLSLKTVNKENQLEDKNTRAEKNTNPSSETVAIKSREKIVTNELANDKCKNTRERLKFKETNNIEPNDSSRDTIIVNSTNNERINVNFDNLESNANILENLFKNLKGWINKINNSTRVNLDESFGNSLYNLNKSYENFKQLATEELSDKWKDNSGKQALESVSLGEFKSKEQNTSEEKISKREKKENVTLDSNLNYKSEKEVRNKENPEKSRNCNENSFKIKTRSKLSENKNVKFTKLSHLCNKNKFCDRIKDICKERKNYNSSKLNDNLDNKYVEIKENKLDLRESLTTREDLGTANQLAGQVTRERADIESDPKTMIQDGRHSRVIELAETGRNKANWIVREEMETENEKKQRIEAEDELVYDYLTDITLEAVNRKRNDRMAMLTRLCERQAKETRPTRKEAEELLRQEKQRTAEINQAVFVKMHNEKMSRTFYDEIILPDENGNPEFEVTSIISVKKLKEEITTSKPINLNITIRGNEKTCTVRYGEEDNVVTSDDESEGQAADLTQDEDKENQDVNVPIGNDKPKVIEDIQIKPPDKESSEKENQDIQVVKVLKAIDNLPAKKELRRALSSRQNPLEGELRPEDKPSSSKTGQEAKSPILTASRGKVTKVRPEFRDSDSDSDWQPVRRRKVTRRSAKK